MGEQNELFETPSRAPAKNMIIPSVDRYEGAMVFSAVGDALGWPTEFLKEKGGRRPPFKLPLRDFVAWQKLVGGRWWGYRDKIAPGEYSDDTQLTLAVARCISPSGQFEPDRFAYSELPLWLHYERGGGRSLKTAARTLISRKNDWWNNFYKHGSLDYRQAGANGSAMRNLPICLASAQNEGRLVQDSFFNAITTHGHPRAILGTVLFAQAVRYVLTDIDTRGSLLIDYLNQAVEDAGRFVSHDQLANAWAEKWEKRGKTGKGSFQALFAETRNEARCYLNGIREFLERPTEEYYRFIGALTPATKGSGLGTVCAAIFLFIRGSDRPEECIYTAVNQLGSDTDTIASFLGALLGARHGLLAVPKHLLERIQDRDYLTKLANRLHAAAAGEPSKQTPTGKGLERQEAYLRILAWEIGLHEMFWDAIDVDGAVVHPTLGRGIITSKDIRKIGRERYVAKLIRIQFDSRQTCVFHSRVEHDEKVIESLAKDVQRALG